MTTIKEFLENHELLFDEKILSHSTILNAAKRKELAAKGEAMPDGSFPIQNVSDLIDAVRTYGLSNNKPAAKAWIIKRAKELDATDKLPDGWVTATHSNIDVKDFLANHGILKFEELNEIPDFLEQSGILGMHWGIRKPKSDASSKEKKHVKNTRRKLIVGTAGLAALGLAAITTAHYKNSPSIKIGELALKSVVSDA